MGFEVELKLVMPPATLETVRRHDLIRTCKQGRGATLVLENTYYDTAERHLLAQKAGLRLRKSGKRCYQTLKLAGTSRGGHFARPEWEWELENEALDLSLLRQTPLAEAADDPAFVEGLQPQFSTNFRRTRWLLSGDEWDVELALDVGEIVAFSETGEEQREPLHEVELELKRGEPHHLYALARQLTEGLPCWVTLASKAERGYALSLATPRQAVKAPPSSVRPEMTVRQAVQAIGRDCLAHALLNEPVVRLAQMPEGVHQFRVALRRLRSAFSLFGAVTESPEGRLLREGIRWLAAAMGDARDLDVFRAEILAPACADMAEDGSLSALCAVIEHDHQGAYQRAVEALQDPRSGALFLHLAHWLEDGDWLHPEQPATAAALEQTLADFSRHWLHRRVRKVRRRGDGFRRLPAETRHQLRIEIKKIRYALEFFTPLYQSHKRFRPWQQHLAILQDMLGALNDAAVAHQRLWQLINREDTPLVAVFAAGLVAGRQSHIAALSLKPAGKAWRSFRKCKPFWSVRG